LKEQLKLLEGLQRYDARIQELEGARKAIPERLEGMRSDLRRVEELVARERAELEETERWRREQETEIKADETQLAKAKAKSAQVRTSKEFMATSREVETTRRMTAEAEEKLAEVLKAAEAARAKIAQHEGDVARLREMVAKEEEAARTRLGSIDADIGEARRLRDEAARTVRPDVLKKYRTIRMRRGLAVVAVKNGTCTGCHMNIPPQLYNVLQRGNSVELCPSCYRIIYWDKIMEDPDGRPSEGSAT
jgi:uncharacterized protein